MRVARSWRRTSTASCPAASAAMESDPAAGIGIPLALAAGLVSFWSPCVLPLVPGYLAAVTGVSVGEIERADWRRVLAPSLVFVATFSAIFVLLGLTASGIGDALRDNRQLLNKVAGAAFAIAWTPCVGPTLAAILTAASLSESAAHGGFLLATYSAGLAIPFVLTAIAFSRMTSAFEAVKRHYRAIMAAGGAVLIVMGVLVYTNELFQLNIEAQKLLDRFGLNFLNEV